MISRVKVLPSFPTINWVAISISALALLLSGPMGVAACLFSKGFAGGEGLAALALLGLWLVSLLSAARFDLMVLVAFGLFAFVRLEPAPSDALFAILLAVGLLARKLSPRALEGSSLIHLSLWTFLAANLFSLIGARPLKPSLRFLAITVYLVAFFYLVRMYVTSASRMRNVVLGYLISAAVTILLVGLGYLGVGRADELFLGWGVRAEGFFKDPNVLGPFLVPLVVLLLDEILRPRLFPGRDLLKLMGVVAFGAGVFLTFSRGAWLNLALALVAYFLLLGRADRARLTPVVLALLLAAIVLTGFVLQHEGLRGFFQERFAGQGYDAGRFARQLEGLMAVAAHPAGVGPGNWSDAHSLYVRTLAENGLLGFLSLLLFILTLVANLARRAAGEVEKPYGLSSKVLLASLLGTLANSFVIDTIHWRHLWLLLALSWAVCTEERGARPRPLVPTQRSAATASS